MPAAHASVTEILFMSILRVIKTNLKQDSGWKDQEPKVTPRIPRVYASSPHEQESEIQSSILPHDPPFLTRFSKMKIFVPLFSFLPYYPLDT